MIKPLLVYVSLMVASTFLCFATDLIVINLAIINKQEVLSVGQTCPLEECSTEITMRTGLKIICDGFGPDPHPCDNLNITAGDIITVQGVGVLSQGTIVIRAEAQDIFKTN